MGARASGGRSSWQENNSDPFAQSFRKSAALLTKVAHKRLNQGRCVLVCLKGPALVCNDLNRHQRGLMFRTALALFFFFIAAMPFALSQGTPAAHHSVLDVDSMDPGVDPCTDFFTYSCGGWLKKNPIPPDKTSWGLSSRLADDNRALLRTILEEAASPASGKDPVKQKIGDYYAACMDEKAIESCRSNRLETAV